MSCEKLEADMLQVAAVVPVTANKAGAFHSGEVR